MIRTNAVSNRQLEMNLKARLQPFTALFFQRDLLFVLLTLKSTNFFSKRCVNLGINKTNRDQAENKGL